MPFVIVPFVTDADTLADGALDRLQEHWDDWEPNDADLEVILTETLAPIAQDVVETAATVPDSIFRQYGTKLLGEPYQEALPATGTATFTALDASGWNASDTLEDGLVEITLQGVAFTTDEPLIIPIGDTTVDATITALEVGAYANGLSGAADLITALPWVALITIDDPTAHGVDGEDDLAYQDRLADLLQLQAKTLVTGRDFEIMALQDPRVGRAVAIVGTARQVTVAITDQAGEPCDADTKADLAATYALYRQVNTTYNVIDPTYTDIDATFQVVALPGYDLELVRQTVIAAITDWLDPANWGKPPDADVGDAWVLDNHIYYNELLRICAQPGVRYVKDATLNGAKVDVLMAGTVALPHPDSIDGTATVS